MNALHQSWITIPVAIIGGSPKCGTSSLFSYLADHPQITASNVKETAFFLEHVTGDLSANAAAYIKYFTPMKPGSIALEGSAAYLGFADEVIPKVRSLLQNVKFIFMLREPVSRFNSYYQYSKSTFRIPANMSFLEFYRACSGDAAGEQLSGVDQYDRYALQHGHYVEYLRKYVDAFGRDRVHTIFLEEFSADPERSMKDVCRFLGIDDAFYRDYRFDVKNRTVAPRLELVHRAAIAFNKRFESILRRNKRVKDILSRVYRRVNVKREGYERISGSDHEMIGLYYRPSVRALQQFLGRTLPWN